MNNKFLATATDEEIAAVQLLQNDFVLWSEKAVRIRTKENGIQPLKLNAPQKRFLEVYRKQWEAEGRVRIIILKARQQGFSTLTSALIYHELLRREGQQACVIGRKGKNTEALLAMYQMIHRELPDYLRPHTRGASQKGYRFDEFKSGIDVETAGSPGLGRGSTFTHVHASEMAFWPTHAAEDNITSLFPTIPQKGSVVVIETTANGMSGPFYDLYQGALRGENEFIPFFSPWFDTPEYAIPVDKPLIRGWYEEKLVAEYGLTDAQLAWRRDQISKTSDDAFEVEYPGNPYEAFKASGGPVFSPNLLNAMKADAAPVLRTVQVQEGKLIDGYTPIKPEETLPGGCLRIYRELEKDEVYTIGADVAEGIQNPKLRDFSVAQVYDGNGFNVATWRGQVEPSVFADVLDTLGRYYHEALLVVERNNHGLSVLLKLNEYLKYQNIYLDIPPGKVIERTTQNLGYHMNNSSKHVAIDKVREHLAAGSIKINDQQTIAEMTKFVSNISEAGNVKMAAQLGSKDDCVTSLAITIACLSRAYRPIEWQHLYDIGETYW